MTAGVYLRPAGVPAERTDATARLLAELWGATPADVTCVPAGAPAEHIADALRAGGGLAFHSSGTTGVSTCAAFDAATRARHIAAVRATIGLTDDLTWCASPGPGFAYGLSIVETHAAAGIPVAFLGRDDPGARLADAARESAASGRPLAVYLTPQALPVLLAAGLAQDAVRRVIVAGGRLSGSAARILAGRFPGVELTNMYGQAELGPRIATWRGPAEEFVEGDAGRPLPGVTVTIGDRSATASAAAPAGTPSPVGPILVASELGSRFVIRDPAAGPEPMPAQVVTGDLGRFDERGHLIHCGRGDHVLNVAGTKVDVEALRRGVEETLNPVAVKILHRPALVAGDVVPIVEVVAAPGVPLSGRDVRRALHGSVGSLAALCEVRVVDRLSVGESGK